MSKLKFFKRILPKSARNDENGIRLPRSRTLARNDSALSYLYFCFLSKIAKFSSNKIFATKLN